MLETGMTGRESNTEKRQQVKKQKIVFEKNIAEDRKKDAGEVEKPSMIR